MSSPFFDKIRFPFVGYVGGLYGSRKSYIRIPGNRETGQKCDNVVFLSIKQAEELCISYLGEDGMQCSSLDILHSIPGRPESYVLNPKPGAEPETHESGAQKS